VAGRDGGAGRTITRWSSTIIDTSSAPGVVDTPLWTQLDADLLEIGDADTPGQAMADFSAGILRGRPATPEDLVGTALCLASSDSDHLTGQVIMANGGMVLV